MDGSFKNKNSLPNIGGNSSLYRSNIAGTGNNSLKGTSSKMNSNTGSSGYNIITGQPNVLGRNPSANLSANKYERVIQKDDDSNKQKGFLSKLSNLSNANTKKNEDIWKSSSMMSGLNKDKGIRKEWDRDVYENYSIYDKEKISKDTQKVNDAYPIQKTSSRGSLYSREGERNKIEVNSNYTYNYNNTPNTCNTKPPGNDQLSLSMNSNSTNSNKPSYMNYYSKDVTEFIAKPAEVENSKITNNTKNFTSDSISSNNLSSKSSNTTNTTPEAVLVNKQVGLDNLGNTCFMNTSLQCLLHTEPFIRRLYKEKDRIFISSKSTTISRAFYDLCNEIMQKKDSVKTSVAPYDFKKVFGQAHRIFSGYSQHDSQEFVRVLLEDISQELNRVTQIPKYRELDTKNSDKIKLNADFDTLFRGREDSIVIDTFYGQTVNIFTCLDCQQETYSFEKFLDIPLLLESDSYSGFTTFDLLDEFFKNDKFKWDSPCENAKCKRKSYHSKTSKLSVLPDILILSFQRYNGRLRRKNSSKINFQESLDMSNYVDKQCIGSKSCKYNLYAISNHTGSLDFGHYYAYVKLNNSWCEFNDSFVSKYFGFSTSSNTVYVLFYQRSDI